MLRYISRIRLSLSVFVAVHLYLSAVVPGFATAGLLEVVSLTGSQISLRLLTILWLGLAIGVRLAGDRRVGIGSPSRNSSFRG